MKLNERIEALQAKYPDLFKDGGPRCGFSINEGWMPLVETLCSNINHHIQSLPEEIRGEMYVSQIKEKFGTLRFYMNQSTPYIDGAISLAESLTYFICEECGASGIRRAGGWVRTLCDQHHKEQEKAKKKLK